MPFLEQVRVIEGRSYYGGRAHTEPRDGWIFFHGANWVHGQKGNPIWELNEKLNLFHTQFLPRTYYARMHNGSVVITNGSSTFVPGDTIRDDFEAFQLKHDHFTAWLEAVGNGT